MTTGETSPAAPAAIDVVALCRDLVAARSENPPGYEAVAAQVTVDVLHEAGFETRVHEAEPNRSNMVAMLRRGPGRRLIFQAHSDTKPATPPGAISLWTVDPFKAEEHDGRLYGLGTCDTKGGLAAQVAAACTLAKDPDWSGELIVQAVADEEDGSQLGAEHLLNLGLLQADGAIVSEPTSCAPSLAQLGNAWAEITVVGRAAHAGHPDRGQDAFRAATHYIAVLDDVLSQAGTSHEFPAHPRLNIGDVAMPGHPGTVPGEIRLRCDIRVLPGAERDDILALYETAASITMKDLDVSILVKRYQGGGCQSHYLGPDHDLARALADAQRATGQPPRTTPFAGGTDARYFAMAGTPALVYGPGSLEQAHAPDEFVPIDELRLAERQLAVAAITFFRADREAKSNEAPQPARSGALQPVEDQTA